MRVFEIVIALLIGGTVLAAIARRIAAPYPALLAVAGAALALVPGAPAMVLDPQLALALFVAPVLLDAAFDASQRDLRNNWRSVLSLALGAVVLTVVAVAIVARYLVPELSWAAAIALGAIVAPPDAAAATAVLKQLRPPQRLLVILEGESLFNDASALLIYRFAVTAAASTILSATSLAGTVVVVFVGSTILALVLARLSMLVFGRVEDLATSVIMQFCSTFAVWLLAERLHLSAILTVVIYAMAMSRQAPRMLGPRLRVPSYAMWVVAVFVLNVLAFILVGLQLRVIVERGRWIEYVQVAAAVCAAVIVARLVWVSGAAFVSRLTCRISGRSVGGPGDVIALSGRAAYIVGWCGMRGIVTLAAALALPIGFPHRDLIFFTSFAVVLVTLVVQGLTLRPLLTLLGLREDDSVEQELLLARTETLRAAIEATRTTRNSEVAETLRRRYEIRLRHVEEDGPESGDHAADAELIARVTASERTRLLELRDNGTIGDAAFQQVEEEIDLRELDLLTIAHGAPRRNVEG